ELCEASARGDALAIDGFAGRQLDKFCVATGPVFDAEVIVCETRELGVSPGAFECGLRHGDASRQPALGGAGESGDGSEADEIFFGHKWIAELPKCGIAELRKRTTKDTKGSRRTRRVADFRFVIADCECFRRGARDFRLNRGSSSRCSSE